MKAPVPVRARIEYLIAHCALFFIFIGVLGLCFHLSTRNGVWDFKFPVVLIMFALTASLPFITVGIFSTRKAVLITDTGLLITYRFKKKKTFLAFSNIIHFRSSHRSRETIVRPARISASFVLTLSDGSEFQFDRSEFTGYEAFKSLVHQRLRETGQREQA